MMHVRLWDNNLDNIFSDYQHKFCSSPHTDLLYSAREDCDCSASSFGLLLVLLLTFLQ